VRRPGTERLTSGIAQKRVREDRQSPHSARSPPPAQCIELLVEPVELVVGHVLELQQLVASAGGASNQLVQLELQRACRDSACSAGAARAIRRQSPRSAVALTEAMLFKLFSLPVTHG
jgi:hypothetical protein